MRFNDSIAVRLGLTAAMALALTSLASWPAASAPEVVVPARTKQMKRFPCMECHDKIDAKDEVVLPLPKTHRDLEFKHLEQVHKCSICHDKRNMDALVLIDGSSVTFDESYLLCGQCHQGQLADWRLNTHGKQVGGWKGVAHKYSCVDCHNAHKPRFPKWVADPPPPSPKFRIEKKEHH